MGCQTSLIVDINSPKKRTIKKLGTFNSFSDNERVREGEKSRSEYQEQKQIQTTQTRTIHMKSTSTPQPNADNPQIQPQNKIANLQQQLSPYHISPQPPQLSHHHITSNGAQNLSHSSDCQQFSQIQIIRQKNKQMSMNISRPTPDINQEQEQKKKRLNNISINRGQAASERKLQQEEDNHIDIHEQQHYYDNSHNASNSSNLNSNNVSSYASSQSLSLPQFNSCRQLHLN